MSRGGGVALFRTDSPFAHAPPPGPPLLRPTDRDRRRPTLRRRSRSVHGHGQGRPDPLIAPAAASGGGPRTHAAAAHRGGGTRDLPHGTSRAAGSDLIGRSLNAGRQPAPGEAEHPLLLRLAAGDARSGRRRTLWWRRNAARSGRESSCPPSSRRVHAGETGLRRRGRAVDPQHAALAFSPRHPGALTAGPAGCARGGSRTRPAGGHRARRTGLAVPPGTGTARSA